MSTEKIRLAFLTWWWHDDQQEMRMSCAQGWALHIWISSRAAIEVELSEPYAVIGDYAACGGGRSVLDVEYAEKITDQMCKKIPVYDRAQLEAAGLKVKP